MLPSTCKLLSSLCSHHYPACFFTSGAKSIFRNQWDPVISLNLKHPTLVLLEHCRSGEHFKQILAQAVRLNLIFHTFAMSRFLYFSAISHPEYLNAAILLFKHFPFQPNLYIYKIMISALSFSSKEAYNLYRSLLHSGIYPDEHTLLSLVKSSCSLSEGSQIHAHIVVTGFHSHLYLQNSLIKMYLDNGKFDMARQVFEHMPKQDSVSYNIMISGNARNGYNSEALKVFHDMNVLGIEPDHYTVSGLLMCCGHLQFTLGGKSVHAWLTRRKPVGDWGLTLSNSLLDMYAKCEKMEIAQSLFDRIEDKDAISWNTMIAGLTNSGELELACDVFYQMPKRDLVSWNSLLSGFGQSGNWKTVVTLFEGMLVEKVRPDKVTAVILIGASSDIGILKQGRCVHGWIMRNQTKVDAFLGSALIDMYCKCGCIEKSLLVWQNVSRKDVPVWTAIITGLAFHGHCIKALEMFQQMQDEGKKPNEVTLIAVLTACSHAGLVDEGCLIFEGMRDSYGIKPGVEHYGCLVDLLSRAGRLIEAVNLVRTMPFYPSQSIWGAILNACKDQGNVELAVRASRELLKLEPGEEAGYILLANAYASGGKWNHSYSIRKIMGKGGLKKTAGRSNIVVSGVVHEFVASDKKHSRREEIYCVLRDLNRETKSFTVNP